MHLILLKTLFLKGRPNLVLIMNFDPVKNNYNATCSYFLSVTGLDLVISGTKVRIVSTKVNNQFELWSGLRYNLWKCNLWIIKIENFWFKMQWKMRWENFLEDYILKRFLTISAYSSVYFLKLKRYSLKLS